MTPLVILASLVAMSMGMPANHTDEHGCVRTIKSDSTMKLDAPKELKDNGKAYDVVHINDAAVIHAMHLKKDLSDGECKGAGGLNSMYGFDDDTYSIWATGKCAGEFHIDYLLAHCELGIKMSSDKNGYSEKMLTSPCMDGRSYKMEISSGPGHDCGDIAYKGKHYAGIGNKYGFHGKMVWVADGCSATFKVCEIGSSSGKENVKAPMMMHH